MKLELVKPKIWSDLKILFNEGSYGIVSGLYGKNKRRSLGLRYNGEDDQDIGYPNSRGYASFFQFFDIPEIEIALLNALQKIIINNEEMMNKYGEDIKTELEAFKNQGIKEIQNRIRNEETEKIQSSIEEQIKEKADLIIKSLGL